MNILSSGPIIEGPSNVTYYPGLTPLPIELICNVTGGAAWIVNGSDYLSIDFDDGRLPGHRHRGKNVLVNSPVNNTEYICLAIGYDYQFLSDPAYIIIAGM